MIDERLKLATELERMAQQECVKWRSDPGLFKHYCKNAAQFMIAAAELNPEISKRPNTWWLKYV